MLRVAGRVVHHAQSAERVHPVRPRIRRFGRRFGPVVIVVVMVVRVFVIVVFFAASSSISCRGGSRFGFRGGGEDASRPRDGRAVRPLELEVGVRRGGGHAREASVPVGWREDTRTTRRVDDFARERSGCSGPSGSSGVAGAPKSRCGAANILSANASSSKTARPRTIPRAACFSKSSATSWSLTSTPAALVAVANCEGVRYARGAARYRSLSSTSGSPISRGASLGLSQVPSRFFGPGGAESGWYERFEGGSDRGMNLARSSRGGGSPRGRRRRIWGSGTARRRRWVDRWRRWGGR